MKLFVAIALLCFQAKGLVGDEGKLEDFSILPILAKKYIIIRRQNCPISIISFN